MYEEKRQRILGSSKQAIEREGEEGQKDIDTHAGMLTCTFIIHHSYSFSYFIHSPSPSLAARVVSFYLLHRSLLLTTTAAVHFLSSTCCLSSILIIIFHLQHV